MKVVRLLVLGTLSMQGPTYGHQIRRAIEMTNMEAWTEIRVGSLYHALHQLEVEGLIEVVRSERQGRLPARTVYAITPEGGVELAALRDRALREVSQVRDPFDIGLWVAGGTAPDDLAVIVAQRLQALRLQRDAIAEERRQLTAKAVLPPTGELLMRHGEARLEADIKWHEELLGELPRLCEGAMKQS